MFIQHLKEKGRSAIAAINGALLCVGLSAGPANAAITFDPLFELDANAKSGDNGGVDWQVYTTPAPGQTGIIPDPAGNGAVVFTGGGSKDINPISQWSTSNKSTPPKDNILNAYAKAGTNSNGDLIVYAGLDRYSNNGTADSGFWFFQNSVSLGSDGKFSGAHSDGDILVVAEYTNGGAVGTMNIFVWKSGALAPYSGSGADCSTNGGVLPCGRTNALPIDMYWPPYTTSGAKAGPGIFLEVGVNVSVIAKSFNLPTPCFSSFLAESRSSATANSVLKDLVYGAFPVCSIKVGKSCPQSSTNPTINSDGTSLHVAFNVPITNSGFGSLSKITLTDTLVDSSHRCTLTKVGATTTSVAFIDGSTAVAVADSLAGGATLNTVVECDTYPPAQNVNPFYNSITASAQTGTTAGSPTISDSHSVTDDPSKSIHESCALNTNPSVTLTKTCKSVYLVAGSNQPQVCVDIAITSTSKEQLSNLTVWDKTIDGTMTLTPPSTTLAPLASMTISNVCYTPSKPDGSGGTRVNPEAAQYSDTVSVDAKGAISGTYLSNGGTAPSIGATCKLCPPPQGVSP